MKPTNWQVISQAHGFTSPEDMFTHFTTKRNLSNNAIARILHLSHCTVQKKRRALGIPASRISHPTNPLAGLDTASMTVNEISQAVGISKSIIRPTLQAHNLPFKRIRNWRTA